MDVGFVLFQMMNKKVWFCRETCSVMEKHELGLCTMEMWLYKDILQKCYPRLYELRFGGKAKRQNRQNNVQQKRKKDGKQFKYNQKKQDKSEGEIKNTFDVVS